MSEEQDDSKILHFIVVERPKDPLSLVNDYVEAIMEHKHKSNEVFRDNLEEIIYLLIDEIHEIVHEETMLSTLLRCGDMLNKKEHYDDE